MFVTSKCFLVLVIIPFSTIVDTVERFAGLNICGFSAIEVFMEIFFRCLGHKCSLLVQLKRGAYIHRKTFAVLLKTVKNMKVSPANLSSPVYSNYKVCSH